MIKDGLEEKRDCWIDKEIIKQAANNGYSHSEALKRFWKETRKLILNGKIELFTSDDVIRQIEVEKYKCTPNLRREAAVTDILENEVGSLPYTFSIPAEHAVRMAAAFLKEKYAHEFKMHHLPFEYPSLSEARLMLTGLANGADFLVTNQIKNFMVFAFLNDELEPCLYDFIAGSYVVIPESLHYIKEDEEFLKYKREVENYMHMDMNM